jgi:hypothetical protein
MSNAGRIAGYGAGRMFGGQVPGEEKNAAIQSVFEQVKGIADPIEQYNKAAELFAQSGFPDLAMQARKTAQTEQLTGYQLKKAKFEADEITDAPVRRRAALEAKFPTLDENQLNTVSKNQKLFEAYMAPTKPGETDIKKVGVAEGTQKPVYVLKQDGNISQVVAEIDAQGRQSFVPYSGAVDQTTSKQTVDVGGAMARALAKAQGDVYKEGWQAAGNSYNTAIRDLPRIQELRASIPQSFTGAGADFRLTLAKAGRLVGIPVDEQQLSNTEYRNSFVSQLTQAIAKNYPGALSNKELDQLLKSLPASSQEPETIDKLLGLLQAELTSQKITYERMANVPMEKRSPEALNLEYGKHYSKIRQYYLNGNRLAQQIEDAKAKGESIKKYLPKMKEFEAIKKEYGL